METSGASDYPLLLAEARYGHSARYLKATCSQITGNRSAPSGEAARAEPSELSEQDREYSVAEFSSSGTTYINSREQLRWCVHARSMSEKPSGCDPSALLACLCSNTASTSTVHNSLPLCSPYCYSYKSRNIHCLRAEGLAVV